MPQRWNHRSILKIAFLFGIAPLLAQNWSAPLPPAQPWHGASEALVADMHDPWITPAEQTGLESTPTYAETVAWLQRLAAASPYVQLVSLGRSPEQRDIWLVVASKEGGRTAAELTNAGKPTLLVQGGIHAGEIDAKDAGLMLLRDMTVGGMHPGLLDSVNFLFVPILNVDGHERRSPFGRINQRGPEGSGWRTTAVNLNLNRDYAKLDAREMRLMVQALNQWDPDLYLDIHVTDGIDYQYDITFGFAGEQGLSPEAGKWLSQVLTPAVNADLREMGHIPGPLIFPIDRHDPAKGLLDWVASPRYSNGYGDARHLPTVLVENHSLKPYRQRVLGTYILISGALRSLARHGESLKRATATDRNRSPQLVPLDWSQTKGASHTIEFLGIGWKTYSSRVSGRNEIRWTGDPITLTVPFRTFHEPANTVARPKAYWIPPAWDDVIERLAIHGIYMNRMEKAQQVEVEMVRFTTFVLDDEPFEGRVRVTAEGATERRRQVYPAGSVRIPTDQPLGDLAIVLLEPKAPDSFLQWGFFNEIFQRIEYVEGYVMVPLAQRMIDSDPSLRAAFRKKLKADPEFASSPKARLKWFYEKTPYYDDIYMLYPVGRER